MNNLIKGYATAEATKQYVKKQSSHANKAVAEGHYSDFLQSKIKLSSIGIGTFPGAITTEVDEQIVQIIVKAIGSGINVIDTAAHYRYGRALAAVGAGLKASFESGVPRESVFIISKGGFLTLRGGPPKNFDDWFEKEIVSKELGSRDDLVNQMHLLSPEYFNYQIELSRNLMGLETLDIFLVDQPEVHIPVIGKEKTNAKLLKVFVALEKAVGENKIRGYGISTFDGMRVETDDVKFQSLTSMLGLAEKAAQEVHGNGVAHSFKMVEMPFNYVMSEGFTRFSHATGQGNVASTLQAAYQLGVYVMASHGLMKGHLSLVQNDQLADLLPMLENPAQRSIQFNRSTPGLGTTLIGMSQAKHLNDVLTVSQISPMTKKAYLGLYSKA
ncbi:MAG: aldo/keto reductase [Gammaproteobacteria bacterium]|nr:aldo/keto reductase [Gammaproteobacteria bacterium]